MAASGRTVVVTGSSTGIGRACALHLDGLGFRVFAGVRRQADAERLRQDASDRLSPVILDVTDPEAIAAASREVAGRAGESGLNGLVNNAGVAISAPLEFIPIDDLRRQLEVNIVGQVAVTQALLPMLRAGRGTVVNVGSVGGRVALPFMGPYHASKFGLEGITDTLRQELAPFGVQVSVVEPGSIATDIWEKGLAAGADLVERMPAEALGLYGDRMEAMRRAAAEAGAAGIPPEAVAKVVARALTARRPRPRYLVGRDAKLQVALARLLPARVLDRIVARQLGA